MFLPILVEAPTITKIGVCKPAGLPHKSLNVTERVFATHAFCFWTQRSGCSMVRRWSPMPRRVTLIPSSPYLCFPCKVWGFSKQTGGDKHMLWTALCWVVSEVQQSRPLSSCSYASHSEVDGRTGAQLYPTGDKPLLGSHGEEIRESGRDCGQA